MSQKESFIRIEDTIYNMVWVKYIKCKENSCTVTVANSRGSGFYLDDIDYDINSSHPDYRGIRLIYDKYSQ